MPCIKCGDPAVATTAGLCKVCAAWPMPTWPAMASAPVQEEPIATCPRCGMYYRPSQGHTCGPGAPTRNVGETDAIKPPDWFRKGYCAVPTAGGVLRMPWDEYFLAICDAVKLRSIDQETQNGAVIINQKRQIVRTGYNAFPAGVDDDFWPRSRTEKQNIPHVSVDRTFPNSQAQPPVQWPAKHLDSQYLQDERFYTVDKYMAMTHAEMNAVVSAGQDLHGCCIYTLLFPCHECAKAIITSGIRRVVYTKTRENASWAVAKELFIQAGVELVGPEKP